LAIVRDPTVFKRISEIIDDIEHEGDFEEALAQFEADIAALQAEPIVPSGGGSFVMETSTVSTLIVDPRITANSRISFAPRNEPSAEYMTDLWMGDIFDGQFSIWHRWTTENLYFDYIFFD